jgi:broad specificity phosphatase PhoE
MSLRLKANVIFLAVCLLLGGCGQKVIHDRKNLVIEGNVILRVHIVRHAEAYKNVPHLPSTPKEKLDSLTPKGLMQAASIGKFLRDKGVVVVITSPTGRTRQTADAIGKALGLDKRYFEDKAFASLRKGKTPNGKPVSWSWRKKQWKAGHDPRPEGGESLADGAARAIGAINQLAKQYPGEAVTIVSHGDICAALLGQAESTSISKRHELHDVATGSVSEIIITDSGWYLLRQSVSPLRYDPPRY